MTKPELNDWQVYVWFTLGVYSVPLTVLAIGPIRGGGGGGGGYINKILVTSDGSIETMYLIPLKKTVSSNAA